MKAVDLAADTSSAFDLDLRSSPGGRQDRRGYEKSGDGEKYDRGVGVFGLEQDAGEQRTGCAADCEHGVLCSHDHAVDEVSVNCRAGWAERHAGPKPRPER